MKFIVCKQAVLAIWLALCVAASVAAAPPFEPPGHYVVSPQLEREADPEVMHFFEAELEKALRLVHELPPQGRLSPFAPQAQSNCRPDVYITTSRDTWVVIKHVAPSETTALLQADSKGAACQGWMQSYLVDRIFFDPQHRLKTGAFLDLVTAAAYQNYGVIPSLVARGVQWLAQPLELEVMRVKEAAVSAAISFLERLRASAKITALSLADQQRLPVLLRELQLELLRLRCRALIQ